MSTLARGHRRLKRRSAAGVLGGALFLLLACAAPASAHVQLWPVAPADGARVAAAPTQLSVQSSEELTPGDLTVKVTRDGVAVPVAFVSTSSTVITIGLGPHAADGSWVVRIVAASSDGDVVDKSYTYVVGSGPAIAPGAAAAGPNALTAARVVADAVDHAAVVVPSGALALLICWPAAMARPRTRRVVLAGIGIGIVASVTQAVLFGPALHGEGLAQIGQRLPALWLTRFGRLALLRAAGLALFGLVVMRPDLRPDVGPRRQGAWVSAGITAGVLVLALVGESHASATAFGLPVELIHVAAILLWFGGLVMLGVASVGDVVPAEAWSRWGRLAGTSLVLAVASGTALALLDTRGPAGGDRTTWWVLLAAKVTLVAGMVGLALVARRRIRVGAAPAVVRRALLSEAAVGTIVLGLAVSLSWQAV